MVNASWRLNVLFYADSLTKKSVKLRYLIEAICNSSFQKSFSNKTTEITRSMSAGKKNMKLPAFLAIDFFSGAGGTTRGLMDAGGYVIAGIDNDDRCEKTYTENNRNTTLDGKCARFLNYNIFPKTEEHTDGQQDLLFEEIESLLSEDRELVGERIPLLFAICAPCQPFTRLARKEMTEERKKRRARDSGLLHEACKFVRRFKPEMVISENVADISGTRFGGVWETFRKELEECGYVTGTEVVCTSGFSVPQYRKRSILLAVRRGRLNPESLKDSDSASLEISVPESDPKALIVTVGEALGHLPPLGAGETHAEIPNHRARSINELNYKRLSVAKPGENNFYMENTKYGDLSLKCHKDARVRNKRGSFSDAYTRMRPNRPSPTITTKCTSISNGRYGHYDTEQIRGISLREAAILQSFQDDYVFDEEESLETVARMIGNAVPPKLVNFYARHLVESVYADAAA